MIFNFDTFLFFFSGLINYTIVVFAKTLHIQIGAVKAMKRVKLIKPEPGKLRVAINLTTIITWQKRDQERANLSLCFSFRGECLKIVLSTTWLRVHSVFS